MIGKIKRIIKKVIAGLSPAPSPVSHEVFFEGYLSNPNLYRFEIAELEQFSGRDVMQEIQDDKIDGIVIKNLFSKEEVAEAVRHLGILKQKNVYQELTFPTDFGEAFGATLMEFDEKEYLRRAKLSMEVFEQMFEGSYTDKIREILQKIAGKRALSEVSVSKDETLATASIRILSPEHSSLEAHIHQEFPLFFPLYKWITDISDIASELSYYVVLQAPEKGGELILYDLRWGDTPTELLQGDKFLTMQRSTALAKYNRTYLRLKEGDMVLFAANRIWHQIAPVKGFRKRITIGSFLSSGYNDGRVYYWI